MTESTITKKIIFRKNFIIFFLTLSMIIYASVFFFFDASLKKILSASLTTINGATVDMKELKTSFFNGSLEIKNLGFTDKNKLSSNLLYFPEIRINLDVSGLLQGKFVINEVMANDFNMDVPRSTPGKINEPEPINVYSPISTPSLIYPILSSTFVSK